MNVKLELESSLLDSQINEVLAYVGGSREKTQRVISELGRRSGSALLSMRRRTQWEDTVYVCTLSVAFCPSFLRAIGMTQ